MTKRSICQENVIFINVYGPNARTTKYRKQKLIDMKGKIDKSKITVEGFNIHLSKIDRK